jgi:phosphoribosyl-ATP pyrophosphohydrolase/phosphoribosyl-AMP cyclohydrolase
MDEHNQSPISNYQSLITNLHFNDSGLIPAIVQDATTGQVLMLAWMNEESLRRTLTSGETWFWSRSRGELWHKGATSGNTQPVRQIFYDCDGDTLLIRVEPAGPACHTGEVSCFFREIEAFHRHHF